MFFSRLTYIFAIHSNTLRKVNRKKNYCQEIVETLSSLIATDADTASDFLHISLKIVALTSFIRLINSSVYYSILFTIHDSE